MYFKLAAGTDDKKNFTDSHFGESQVFLIYEVKDDKLRLIEERENQKFDEEKHGDEKKASHISAQLKDVNVLVGRVFGPNIVRIRKKFVPVLSKEKNIEKSLNELILKYRDKLVAEITSDKEEKDIIRI